MATGVLAIGKGILFGWLLGSLIGICVVLTIGTISIATGQPESTVGLGPIPIATVWSNASGYGLHSEWGLVLFTIAGMVVGGLLAIRSRLLPASV
jgi:uncharacterized membrane protein AbrB (regulator of aidB expression)